MSRKRKIKSEKILGTAKQEITLNIQKIWKTELSRMEGECGICSTRKIRRRKIRWSGYIGADPRLKRTLNRLTGTLPVWT